MWQGTDVTCMWRTAQPFPLACTSSTHAFATSTCTIVAFTTRAFTSRAFTTRAFTTCAFTSRAFTVHAFPSRAFTSHACLSRPLQTSACLRFVAATAAALGSPAFLPYLPIVVRPLLRLSSDNAGAVVTGEAHAEVHCAVDA